MIQAISQARRFVEISAPGKLIISGQHSVVYGKNALCASIDLRCRCFGYVNASHHGRITFQLKDLNQQVVVDWNSISGIVSDKVASESYTSFLAVIKQAASAETLYKYKTLKALECASPYFQQEDLMNIRQRLSAEDHTFLIDSSIPVGKGLGSSAATSVCVAAALLCLFERLANKSLSTRAGLVNDIAFQYERVYHSNPSGVDNFVSVNGGLVIFNRNSTEMKKLNWPFSSLNILLIDSQIEKNTKKAVEHVRYLYDHENGKPLIEEIAVVTDNIILNIQRSEETKFLEHVRLNHSLLKQLGLSNTQIQQIVEQHTSADSAAKITGAGMGGYVVVFTRHPSTKSMSISSGGLSIQLIH